MRVSITTLQKGVYSHMSIENIQKKEGGQGSDHHLSNIVSIQCHKDSALLN